jgi:hypothetical protein
VWLLRSPDKAFHHSGACCLNDHYRFIQIFLLIKLPKNKLLFAGMPATHSLCIRSGAVRLFPENFVIDDLLVTAPILAKTETI